MRKCLRLLVAEGYRPMHFYQHDLQKYYYLGELMALVDLSLVSTLESKQHRFCKGKVLGQVMHSVSACWKLLLPLSKPACWPHLAL